MKKYIATPFLLLLFIAFFIEVKSQQIAFPGAEGFGKYATGGRGGKVYEVTNLDDSGPGSFREAFNAYPGEPLTIVFRVSGVIDLATFIKVNRSNITIAGQTAPGDGICLKGSSFLLNGARVASQGGNHGNIIIRFLRSRPGSTLSTGVYGFDMENCHDVMIDHCSFSWANEECAAMYDTKNVTVQWTIVSEGLYNAGHMKGVRSYGGVWGGQFATYHHNLIAHCVSRTIRPNGSRAHDTLALIDYRNNVIYNWGSSSACYGGEVEIPNGVSKINLVNNYYKPGPATSSTLKFAQAYNAAGGTGMWHLSGNVMEGSTIMTTNNWLALDLSRLPVASRDSATSDTAFIIGEPLPVQSATDAFDSVMANAGAIWPIRDAVDNRVLNETKTKTATGLASYGKLGIIDLPSDVGGWPVYNTYEVPADSDHDGMPDVWEQENGLNPIDGEDRNAIDIASGYTMLEVYLNRLALGYKPVPLKLLSLSAASNNKTITLSWSIAQTSISNKGWSIERADQSMHWKEIGFVTNTVSNKYSFLDNDLSTGTYQYRLKQVAIDGKVTYSNIIVIKIGSPLKGMAISTYPNPFTSSANINYSIPARAKVQLLVYNSEGQLMATLVDKYLEKAVYQETINTTQFSPGKYFIILKADDKVITSSMIKAH